MNTFPALVDFDISGTEGPIATFLGVQNAWPQEEAAVGGDGIIVVLYGFPSFLHDRSNGY